jgi:glycosyltransferase involved in cell wall biosynthesis
MKPKISVITISYNSAKYIQLAIESVLAQSFIDFEYIIGDDCSTDNTWEIINEYDDFRIKKYRNEKNIGEYPNRNKSLEFATGEYVIWIDGDDIFYPHGLEFMVKMLDAFPNSAMACARPYWQNMVYPYELTPIETFTFELLSSPVLVDGFPDTLFRTEILKKIGGLSENIISGDTYTKRKIALNHNVLLVSKSVSWWRIRDGQASSKLKTYEGVLEVFNNTMEFIEYAKSLFTEVEYQTAIERAKKGVLKKVVKLYISKKCFKILKFLKDAQLSFFSLYLIFKKNNATLIEKDIINRFYILPFEKNPFSKKHNF